MADVKILIVEDELITVELIRGVLEGRGYLVTGSADTGPKALDLIEHERPDLILMDVKIKGDIDGIELARIINERHRIPVIYLTAFADRMTVDRAKQTDSYGYIIKPFGETELLTNIEIALYKHRFDIRLKESEERYRTLFETMKDGMYMHDMDGVMIDFNPAMNELLGYTREELLGMVPPDVFADKSDLKPFIKTIMKNGYIKDFETKFIRKDGLVINCLISANLEMPPEGNKKLIRGIIRDITESEKTRRALQEEQDFTAAVLESLPSMFYAIDREGKFVRWNRRLEDISGFSGDRLQGVSVFELMNKENREIFEQKFKEGLSEGEMILESRLSITSEGGVFRDFIITGRRVEIGGAEYIVGAGVDITERKHAEEALRKSFDEINDLYNNAPCGYHSLDPQGVFIKTNDTELQWLGYSREELVGKLKFSDLLTDSSVKKFNAEYANFKETGSVQNLEFDVIRKDGTIFPIVLSSTAVKDPRGAYVMSRTTLFDITERKRIDEALRRSEEQYRRLVENLNDAIFTLDWDGVITYMSPALERISHYRVDDVVGKHFKELVHPDDLKELAKRFARTLGGETDSFEFRVIDKDGSVRHVRTSSRINIENGSPTGLTGLMSDITDRKRIEEELQESENRYRAIFDGSMNMVYLFDLRGVFVDANDATLELLECPREKLLTLSFKDLVSGEEYEKGFEQSREVIKYGGQSRIVEFNLKTGSGSYRSVETTVSPLYREGKPYAILGVARDVTERKKFLEELKNIHAENMYILNSITSLLIGVSTLDVITHWNYMAEQTFGIPATKALGEKITGFNIDWDWAEIYTGISSCIIEKGPVNLTDIKFKDKNGTEGLLGITINPITGDDKKLRGFLIYGKDITERRLAEQQLLQSSKMASVGEMATGVAHEINQPLNIIKMASQFMLDGINEKYATEEFLKERAGKIIAQVDRAAHIINHLREFGRKSDYDFGMIDPNQPIRVAFDMLGEQLRLHSINPVLELDNNLPVIRGDIHKLEQVFINLIVNSKDALDDMKNSLQEKNIVVRSNFKEQRSVICVEFNDNGPGIPDEMRDRIFEPFFTTKEVGKGTGLGLSISYGIIKAHGGTIEVVANAGGTTFTINLPVESGLQNEE